MGRVLKSKQQRQADADADLARLRKEYDADRGGYTITYKSSGGKAQHRKTQTEFIKSSFTPEQGGYYADQSILRDSTRPYSRRTRTSRGNEYRFYDSSRATYISGKNKGTGLSVDQIGQGGAAGRAKTKADAEGYRKFPARNVNPSLISNRKSRRRKRALQAGRSGTILTGTLGQSQEKDRNYRKTLLG